MFSRGRAWGKHPMKNPRSRSASIPQASNRRVKRKNAAPQLHLKLSDYEAIRLNPYALMIPLRMA